MHNPESPLRFPLYALGQVFESPQALNQFYDSKAFLRYMPAEDCLLGLVPEEKGFRFRLWAPLAARATLCLYEKGSEKEWAKEPIRIVPMKRLNGGIFEAFAEESAEGCYYTYQLYYEQSEAGEEAAVETPDPYGRLSGADGHRTLISKVPYEKPKPHRYRFQKDLREAIVWETHVRDFSYHPSSPMTHKGKYLAFTEPEGLSYLKELGITHVQLLPVMDFASVDEAQNQLHPEEDQYNWGYDPYSYFVPEGSYASDCFDAKVRFFELQKAIEALHESELGVVLDVVYNHVYQYEISPLQLTAPYYFFRLTQDGIMGNASGCGNEIASERPMVKRLIIESIRYFATVYQVDGFRFDLMGVLDTELMNQIAGELAKIGKKQGKNLLIYGEPWAALPVSLREGFEPADKGHLEALDPAIGVFNDDFRDAIKGSSFRLKEAGFIQGLLGLSAVNPFQVLLSYLTAKGAIPASRAVNYESCHDNMTLWDKLEGSSVTDGSGFDSPEMRRIALNKMAAALVLLCPGAAFLHSGEEFGRTKYGNDNSYRSPSMGNALDWGRRDRFRELLEYYKGLIALRKRLPILGFGPEKVIDDAEASFKKKRGALKARVLVQEDTLIGYELFPLTIEPREEEEERIPSGATLVVLFNAGDHERCVTVEKGVYHILCDAACASDKPERAFVASQLLVKQRGVLVAIRE